MTGRLEAKVAVITGAAAGIGAATARRFAGEGASVVVADIDGDGADAVAGSIVAEGGSAVAVRADVSVEDDIVALLDAAEQEFARVDVLHSNAAAGLPDDLNVVSTPISTWDFNVRVNLLSVVLGAKHAIPRMAANSGGVVLNTASYQAYIGDHARIAYGAVKAAVIAATRSIATTHGRKGIRCNAIAPGLVMSEGARELFSDEMLAAVLRQQAIDRVVEPEDVADLALFLCSDESRSITGQVVVIDAGGSAVGPVTADLDDILHLSPD